MNKIPVRSYSLYEMIKIIEADDWRLKNIEGDHHHFVHPTKSGNGTIPHPVKNIPKRIAAKILKQAGLR